MVIMWSESSNLEGIFFLKCADYEQKFNTCVLHWIQYQLKSLKNDRMMLLKTRVVELLSDRKDLDKSVLPKH